MMKIWRDNYDDITVDDDNKGNITLADDIDGDITADDGCDGSDHDNAVNFSADIDG